MRLLLAFLLGLCASGVFAATPEETVRQAFATMAPQIKIDAVQESPIPGFYEAIAGGQFIYVSKDGKYLLDGNAYDVQNKRDLTEISRARLRKTALTNIGADKRIIFAADKPKHTITVFTDIDCPFCRRFHAQMAEYNKRGIAIEYVFYPLSIHPGADKKAEAVWCAKDRKAAYTAAMNGQESGKESCSSPVAELTEFAKSIGITGTPTVLAADGTQIASAVAMSPDQLAAELDRLAQLSVARN